MAEKLKGSHRPSSNSKQKESIPVDGQRFDETL